MLRPGESSGAESAMVAMKVPGSAALALRSEVPVCLLALQIQYVSIVRCYSCLPPDFDIKIVFAGKNTLIEPLI